MSQGEEDHMYLSVEAMTRRGIRRFIIAGDTSVQAETEMRAILRAGERIMDESGDWFEAREIDASSVVAKGVPVPPAVSLSSHFTSDGQRMV
jgi:hypothetical protein